MYYIGLGNEPEPYEPKVKLKRTNGKSNDSEEQFQDSD